MSVLGDKNVRNCIKLIGKDIDGESKCGAFWVRFHKYGDIEGVIIDNFFPVLGNGEFAFARGESDGKELWPMVLEKAYVNWIHHMVISRLENLIYIIWYDWRSFWTNWT